MERSYLGLTRLWDKILPIGHMWWAWFANSKMEVDQWWVWFPENAAWLEYLEYTVWYFFDECPCFMCGSILLFRPVKPGPQVLTSRLLISPWLSELGKPGMYIRHNEIEGAQQGPSLSPSVSLSVSLSRTPHFHMVSACWLHSQEGLPHIVTEMATRERAKADLKWPCFHPWTSWAEQALNLHPLTQSVKFEFYSEE